MSIYRIHIKPDTSRFCAKDAFGHCLRHSILGVGWDAEVADGCSWAEYLAAAKKKGYKNRDIRLVSRLYRTRPDDLIWTRHAGIYYLGRVIGPWRYTNQGAPVGLHNVVPCQLRRVQVDEVPGKVTAAFRPSRTFQRVSGVDAYSQLLWNTKSSEPVYRTIPASADIFDLLDWCELEDAANLHLQVNGWMVIASSRRPNTAAYENYLVNPESGETAVLQVKGGGRDFEPGKTTWRDLLRSADKVFLFQAKGHYGSEIPPDGVCCIAPDEVRQTLFSNRPWIPGTIRHWLDIAGQGETTPSTDASPGGA